MPLSYRFHHVGVAVADLEASVAWYREKLGLDVEKRFTLAEAEVDIAKLVSPTGVRVELLRSLASPPPGRVSGGLTEPGAKHLCLWVDDVEDAVEELRSRGVRVAQEPQVIEASQEKNAWVLDGEDNMIELIEELP